VARDHRDRESRRDRKKRQKPPIGQRIGDHIGSRARALGELGDDIVNRPKELPGKAHGWFRLWFAKVWRLRGGGLYACGFAVTFVIFEVRTLIEDLAGGMGLGGLFSGDIVAFFLDFLIDSLVNTVSALMWPVYVVLIAPPYGAIGLGLAYMFFASVLKQPIERWLFDGEAGSDMPQQDSSGD